MRLDLERRLARVERETAARKCNCLWIIEFHNSNCLEAVLKGLTRVCPKHGFRCIAYLTQVSKPIWSSWESSRFCPCDTDHQYYEAKVDPTENNEEENQINLLVEQYAAPHEEWCRHPGRDPGLIYKGAILALAYCLSNGIVQQQGLRIYAQDISLFRKSWQNILSRPSLTIFRNWPEWVKDQKESCSAISRDFDKAPMSLLFPWANLDEFENWEKTIPSTQNGQHT